MKFIVDTEKISYDTLISIAKDIGYVDGDLFEFLMNNTQRDDLEPGSIEEDPEWEISKYIYDAIDNYNIDDITKWIGQAPSDIWDEDGKGEVGTMSDNYKLFCENRRWNVAHMYARKIREDLENRNDFEWKQFDKYIEMQNENNIYKIDFDQSRIHPKITKDNQIEYEIDWVK